MHRAIARGALLLVACYVLVAVPTVLWNDALRLHAFRRTALRSPAEVRAMAFGRAYVAAIERIRTRVPVDDPYVLARAEQPVLSSSDEQQPSLLWVRFDLLPRRAVVVVRGERKPCWQAGARWLVVTHDHAPPSLVPLPLSGEAASCAERTSLD